MKIKLYCKVPNDIFITFLFLFAEKVIVPMITVPPNQSLSLFLDGEGKTGNEYFLVCYHRCMLPLNGFWRPFCVGVGLVLDRTY